jgi:hypothetical protein
MIGSAVGFGKVTEFDLRSLGIAIIGSIALLLLAVVHAPSQAQALVFSVFQDLLPFSTTNEPITLFLTGVALLSLAQLGRPRSQ